MIQPFFDRVLLEKQEKKPVAGEIFVPNAERAKSYMMRVLKVGSDCKFVREGMQVAIARYAGIELPDSDGRLFVARECDIVGVFE